MIELGIGCSFLVKIIVDSENEKLVIIRPEDYPIEHY